MKFTDGHYVKDMLIFGNFDKSGFASRGFEIHPPDLRNGAIDTLHEFEDKLRRLLVTIQPPARTQWHWSVNSDYNEGAQSVSADGKFLVFTICNRPNGLGRCDLYFTEYKNKKWTAVRNIGRPINSAEYESLPSISADGKSLYFTCNRKGGLGGLFKRFCD